ncbi:MAG TPA: MaoC family dehydratase, partial [Myxococcota bacterium]|nr:MaoC family dehydratase [Myxococcota bacterium]
MQTLSFESTQVQAWCTLSGDDNPIHSDLEAARRLGLGNLVVPGMLAILHGQQALHGVVQGHATPGWWQSRLRLKRPIPVEAEVHCSAKRSSRGGRVTLADAKGEPYYTGTCEITAAATVEALPPGNPVDF